MAGTLGTLTVLCLLLTVLSANGQESLAEKNKRDIAQHDGILRDKVRKDLNKLKEKFKGLVEHVNDKLTKLRQYTTKAINELKSNAETSMESGDTALTNNIQKLEQHIKEKINELNDKMKINFEALSELSSSQGKLIYDWNEKRSKQNEEILSTEVSLCAYDHSAYYPEGNQTVTYAGAGGGFLDGHKSWQVLGGPRHDDEAKAMEVLNRETGKFIVPENASGLYMFTFSVTMDTAGFKYEPSEYLFEKFAKGSSDGEVVAGTGLYSDAGVPIEGRRAVHDMVPGSNTVLLQLEAGDGVGVRQTRKRTLTDYQVSFCGTLLHLEKATESPGGLEADSTGQEFPPVMRADIEAITLTDVQLDDVPTDLPESAVPPIDTTYNIANVNLTATDPNNWKRN